MGFLRGAVHYPVDEQGDIKQSGEGRIFIDVRRSLGTSTHDGNTAEHMAVWRKSIQVLKFQE